MIGYEKSAKLHDIFDTKDNIDFFVYALKVENALDIGAGTG